VSHASPRAEALAARWTTPDGQRRREQLIESGLRGPWREVLAGFPGTEALGDNLGDLRGIDLTQEELTGADLVRARSRMTHPQPTVALLLRDADFESRARERMRSPSPTRLETVTPHLSDVRACLEWGLHLRTTATGLPTPVPRGPVAYAQRWLLGLREQVDPGIQAQWSYTPPVPD
jgi:hypothetical protein